MKFAPLGDCRRQFAFRAGAPDMEWEPTNEEEGRADAAGQINRDGDRPAKLRTPPDAPKLAPESDTELGLASNGAARQGSESGKPAASPVPEKDPAQDELDGQWEAVEEEPEDVEWELIEDECNDVEWEAVEEEPDDVEWEPRDDEADDA